MKEYFDIEGHLTDFALEELLYGEPDEMTRMETSEHLSFCDECIKRYSILLEDYELISPIEPVAQGVIRKIRIRAIRIVTNKYATMAAAACFALALWTNGIFDMGYELAKRDDGYNYTVSNTLVDTVSNKMEKIFDDIYHLRGVFENGK